MKFIRPIILILVLTATARAAPATRPTTPIAPGSCVTAECHANVKAYKVVHGPVNVDACDACHKSTDDSKHEFALARPQTDVCTFCHQLDVSNMPVVHKPVAEGQCLGCHDPHGGTTAKFIRGQRMEQMCAECHKDVIANKSRVHGPVAAGACVSCHPAHASQYPKLLIAEGNDLCFTCHQEMKQQMATVAFKHKAVEQDCSACHDAHASDYPMQTRFPPIELCTSCHEHEAIREAALAAKNKHSIVTQGDACLNCHTAHGGDLAKLMRTEQIKVCMKCHEQPQQAADGRKVNAVPEVLNTSLTKHGPVAEGSCGGCHNVHGSEVSRLLAKNYPQPFYQGFSLEKYDLCFSCHDKQLVLTERTTGLTRFRNGQDNLHFLHVNKSDRGRNCRACHATHAAQQPLLVRQTVPYGGWEMPINFAQTETGGSCAPGCHKAYQYDRVKPVVYEAPPATPAAAVPSPPPTTQEAKP